jgi:hypothetical protein
MAAPAAFHDRSSQDAPCGAAPCRSRGDQTITGGQESPGRPPCREYGETWRPLKATFPDSIASHSRKQVSYFGEDGL